MRRIDLNAARAARAEAQSEPVTVDLGDDTFTLVSELPIDFVTLSEAGQFRSAARLLFPDSTSDAEFERFMGYRLTIPDLLDIAKAYTGMSAGESQASPRSSTNRSKRARPTSKATTA